MARKKSDVQIGNEREEKFRDMRISQGYLSFKRQRKKFGPVDLWNCFDVLSMKGDVIELCQVKGPKSRGEQERIREWLRENKDKIPGIVRCICAYEDEKLGTFRIVEVTE